MDNVIDDEKNIESIRQSIDSSELQFLSNEYKIDYLAYIPFLISSRDVNICNLSEQQIFTSNNINLINVSLHKTSSSGNDELSRYNINGDLLLSNITEPQDFYYQASYNTTEVEADDLNSPTGLSLQNYINTDTPYYGFMFYFTTDDVTPRTIATFNSNGVLSINEKGYFAYSTVYIDYEYGETLNLVMTSQSRVRTNRKYHIAVFRLRSLNKWKHVLFIDGGKHAEQDTAEEISEIAPKDQSGLFNSENPIKSIFHFSNSNGKYQNNTYIDEMYIFNTSQFTNRSNIEYPSIYKIIAFPIEVEAEAKIPFEIQRTITDFETKKFKRDVQKDLYDYKGNLGLKFKVQKAHLITYSEKIPRNVVITDEYEENIVKLSIERSFDSIEDIIHRDVWRTIEHETFVSRWIQSVDIELKYELPFEIQRNIELIRPIYRNLIYLGDHEDIIPRDVWRTIKLKLKQKIFYNTDIELPVKIPRNVVKDNDKDKHTKRTIYRTLDYHLPTIRTVSVNKNLINIYPRNVQRTIELKNDTHRFQSDIKTVEYHVSRNIQSDRKTKFDLKRNILYDDTRYFPLFRDNHKIHIERFYLERIVISQSYKPFAFVLDPTELFIGTNDPKLFN